MRLASSLSRRPEELPPPPARIGMYFCGPTVYQRIHVGNARPYVISMWLKRWLERRGYDVTLVENVTDVNDKIYEAAPGASGELAERATRWYVEDTDGLGLGRPDVEPRATESIPEIVALIEELVAGGFAYPAGGDVYFRVARYPEYGALSGQRPDEMVEQEPNPRKEDPRDFALWKATKEGEDTWWDSPWGRGRPGWHIECSAMAERHLGPEFCIHGGGIDLIFPHHENELAQSRAAGRGFARVWMHNGMLRFTGEKMSKSLGNVATLQEVLRKWGREALLMFFMTAHWSKPIDYSDDTMLAAAQRWRYFQGAYLVPRTEPPADEWDRLVAALDEDFNTPAALAVLHDWRSRGFWHLLDRGLEVFGLELPATAGTDIEAERLRQERDLARARKDWQEADHLRDEINRRGFEVQDGPDGSRLIRRR